MLRSEHYDIAVHNMMDDEIIVAMARPLIYAIENGDEEIYETMKKAWFMKAATDEFLSRGGDSSKLHHIGCTAEALRNLVDQHFEVK